MRIHTLGRSTLAVAAAIALTGFFALAQPAAARTATTVTSTGDMTVTGNGMTLFQGDLPADGFVINCDASGSSCVNSDPSAAHFCVTDPTLGEVCGDADYELDTSGSPAMETFTDLKLTVVSVGCQFNTFDSTGNPLDLQASSTDYTTSTGTGHFQTDDGHNVIASATAVEGSPDVCVTTIQPALNQNLPATVTFSAPADHPGDGWWQVVNPPV